MNFSEPGADHLLNDLLCNVVSPMEQALQATLPQGMYSRLTPPSGHVLMAYLDLFPDPGSTLSAQFLVQRDPDGWSVHRLMYSKGPEGLQRLSVPPLTFETLPDAPFFLGLLQDFVAHELTLGSLRFD